MLSILLKRSGLCTGPLTRNTSHSSLEVIKKYLLGYPQFQGEEYFLKFGSALHEVFLQGIRNHYYKMLNKEDRATVDAMVKKLNAHPIVVLLMTNSTREEKFSVKLNRVLTTCILDAKQPALRRGFDLKTTNATSQRDFEDKIKSLGYVRQALTYKLAAKLKFFYFVGITKTPPYNIYIADIDSPQFSTDMIYAQEELKFLLYFFKNYGNITIKKNNGESSVKKDPRGLQRIQLLR